LKELLVFLYIELRNHICSIVKINKRIMEQDVAILHVFLSAGEVSLAVCTHVGYYSNFKIC
jgi:hypothetical protein